jgi:hypothetical protein
MRRTSSYLRDAILAGALALAAAIPASAQTITDFNFDSLTIGQNIPVTFPGVDPFPQHTVYAVGGFPNDGPELLQGDPGLTGSVTVQNVGTLSKAALMSTTQAGTGALFIDTQFLAGGPTFDLSFDIDVVDVPTTGLAQAGVGAPDGQAFAINVFGLDSNRLFRFAVSPTSATTGTFGYRLPGPDGDLATFGAYTEGETHHVSFHTDFGASNFDVFLDGSQVVNNAALLSPGTGVSELFIFQNGVDGVTNSVALDNIHASIGQVTPEPSSIVLLAGGGGGMLFSFLLRKRSIVR